MTWLRLLPRFISVITRCGNALHEAGGCLMTCGVGSKIDLHHDIAGLHRQIAALHRGVINKLNEPLKLKNRM